VKRALLQQRELKAQVRELERARREPIAVVGMGCRFPGSASNPAALWRMLEAGGVAIAEVPADRWNAAALYDPNIETPGKISSRFGGFVRDLADFDPHFFGLSPREALSMDPQQRLLLEVCWEALENAGLPVGGLAGSRTGVFVGLAISDYLTLHATRVAWEDIDAYTAIGTAESVVAGRISYLFGLKGPSLVVNTACSSSLVSVHLACQSLRLQECRAALAGGVNALLTPEHWISLSRAGVLAPDGRCKTFDAAADGFGRAEGCGVVVLKRLSDALADGDNVLALIRGSAVNHDGRSNGLTAPNGPSQEAVIRDALQNAGVDPAQVSYVEAHGTGTALGDPIEVQALANVLRAGRRSEAPVLLGSLKTNLGHMESAAGVGGLIKTILALQHAKIPPHPHFQKPNPHIPWAELPVRVVTALEDWPEHDGTRIAGVSSFGFSGTNAHVILEQAPARVVFPVERDRPRHLFCLSAKSEPALLALVERHESQLAHNRHIPIGDLCHSANAGRDHFEHRLCLSVTSREDLQQQLRATHGAEASTSLSRGTVDTKAGGDVVFLFSGQGSSYPGMGRELYETQPTFRKAIARCDELLRPRIEGSLIELLYGANAGLPSTDDTASVQPILFSLQYALAEMWRSWGIVPSAVAGHSVGEIAAAVVAGILELEDGIRLIAERGRLSAAMPAGGAMAVICAPLPRVQAALPSSGCVCIAAINGPENIVLSGPRAELDGVVRTLANAGIETRPLGVLRAFHSAATSAIVDQFRTVARTIPHREPQITFVSTVTGRVTGPGEINAEYWCQNLQQPVRFEKSVHTLLDLGPTRFLEIGPGTTLVGMAAACTTREDVGWVPSLKNGVSDWARVLESLALLYLRGAYVDWVRFDEGYGRRRWQLPGYPFQRQRYWPEFRDRVGAGSPQAAWAAALRAAERQADQVPLRLNLPSYELIWAELDQLTTAYVVDTLVQLGAFRKKDEIHTPDSLRQSGGILDLYRDLLGVWFERLVSAGLLERTAQGFRSPQPLVAPDLSAQLAQVRTVARDLPILIDYLERCGRKIVPILRGEQNPINTLFPDGSFETAEFFYQHWALAQYFNNIVSRAVSEFCRADGRAETRLLEVGAGTGGTSAAVLPALPPDKCRYQYTDLSNLFLQRAQDKFSTFKFLGFGILDIGKDPLNQGYAPHSFDVLLAANSLHATPDLGRTVEHARSLLAPGGLLVLYEVTRHLPWFETSIALIEGWQLYDDGLRAEHPLLTPAKWRDVLLARGFEAVQTFPPAGSPAEVLGHHVIIAHASGAGERAAATPAAAPESRSVPAAAAATRLQDLKALEPAEAREALVEFVREHVMRVLRLGTDRRPGRSARLMDLGVDSLMAIELKKRLSDALGGGYELPATLIFDFPTIDTVAGFLWQLLGLAGSGAVAAEVASKAGAELEGLSESELEQILLKKLEHL
jgi:acyl transferase domain-containing protein/SAM-dependent methyltransferase